MDRKMINDHNSCYVGLKTSDVIVISPKDDEPSKVVQ